MDNRIKPSPSLVGASGNTGFIPQRGMVDGSIFSADWLARMALEGRMYTIHSGTGTAPTTFNAAYTNTAPDVDILVPAGVMAIPISLNIQFEAYGTILLTEVVGAVGNAGAQAAATAVTPVNHRLDLGDSSGLTCRKASTGATYMTSNIVEFFRDGHQGDVTVSAVATGDQAENLAKFKWSALETGNWPIMYNPSAATRLNVFACSQAGTGFITVTVVVPPLSILS